MGKIKRGINGKFYWVFRDEYEANSRAIFSVIRLLRFFGMKCHGHCFNGYYNAWELF